MSAAADFAAATSRKAAKEAAEAQAKAAAKVAAESAARSAKAAAKSAADAAADAAAKSAKAAADAAKPGASAAVKAAAAAAAKSADELAAAAAAAAKNSDELTAVAGAAAKGSRGTALRATALLAGGGAIAGGVLYVDQKLKEADENIQDCMKVCLPDNWDEYYYDKAFDRSKLAYKALDDPGDQPVCKENMDDCGEYCEDKCTELHEYKAPGTTLLDRGADAASNAFKAINPFQGLFGDMGGLAWIPCAVLIVVILIVLAMVVF